MTPNLSLRLAKRRSEIYQALVDDIRFVTRSRPRYLEFSFLLRKYLEGQITLSVG